MTECNNIRYFVCFNCKVFIPIYPENPKSQIEIENFKAYHNKHMTQTVNFCEIPKEYKCQRIKKENDKEM